MIPKTPRLNVIIPPGKSDIALFHMHTNAHTEKGVMVTNRKLNTRQNRMEDNDVALSIRDFR